MAHLDSWVGAPTPSGFTVVATLSPAPTTATLHVSTDPSFADTTMFPMSGTGRTGTFRGSAMGLTSGTRYWWGIGEDGGTPVQLGTARTALANAGSFSFWSSSCAVNSSAHPVFTEILDHSPDFGLHLGDLHYRNISTNDLNSFHYGYHDALRSPTQGPLYRNVPTFYIWDDHDYGPNDSDYASPSRPAAITAYRQRVPHLPLPHTEAIYQTFTYGRVRFILLDGRAMRKKDASTSMLGLEQKQWLKDTLAAATEPVAVISTAVPWMGTGVDSWGGYAAERLEIADWLVANGWKGRVILVAGDAHSISYDTGVNNTYGGLNAPVFQTAALDQSGSTKGGTYTRPPVLNRGQYGLWEVTDTGGATINFALKAYSEGSLLYTETVTFGAATEDPDPPQPASGFARANGDPVTFARANGDPVMLI